MNGVTRVLGRIGALVVLGSCQQPAPKFTAQDDAAVRGLFDSTVAHIRAGKLESWAGLFAADARFYPAHSPVLVGRPAILAWGKSLPPIDGFAFSDVAVTGEGNLAHGSSRVFLQLRGLPADTSKQLIVAHRDSAGRWLVQAVAVSTDLPMPSVTPPPPARKK